MHKLLKIVMQLSFCRSLFGFGNKSEIVNNAMGWDPEMSVNMEGLYPLFQDYEFPVDLSSTIENFKFQKVLSTPRLDIKNLNETKYLNVDANYPMYVNRIDIAYISRSYGSIKPRIPRKICPISDLTLQYLHWLLAALLKIRILVWSYQNDMECHLL